MPLHRTVELAELPPPRAGVHGLGESPAGGPAQRAGPAGLNAPQAAAQDADILGQDISDGLVERFGAARDITLRADVQKEFPRLAVADAALLEKEVVEREELGNTGIGRGIGFPHSKSSQTKNILVLLARPIKPIDYGAIDNMPVSIILLLVAPAEGVNNEYLHTMARISRLLGKNDVRQKIIAARSPEDVIAIIGANEA